MDYLEVKDKVRISILIVLFLCALVFFQNIYKVYLSLETYLINAGLIKAAFIFGLAVMLLILITPMSISPLSLISGVVFGSVIGLLITSISATIGATISFLVGRFFLHDYFAEKFKKNNIYRKMLEEEHRHILRFIFTSRLVPHLPFELISYMAGITTMPLWKFMLATFLGIVPIVFLFSFFGQHFDGYRILALVILVTVSIFYMIVKMIRYKRYYVKGY